MQKIVIIPTFCEAHLIRLQVDNIFATIDPDILIYNEVLFPAGPEGGLSNPEPLSQDFINKYTLDGDGVRGFDHNELEQIIGQAQQRHPDCRIILHTMSVNTLDASQAYVKAVSNFAELGIVIQAGDVIFPLEGDAFHHEKDRDAIQDAIMRLTPNTGYRTEWVDFLGNQYFTAHKTNQRRFCVCVGSDDFYYYVVKQFMTQQYPMLSLLPITTYHYAWFRPGKYRDLRYDQLKRREGYWQDFDRGLNEACGLTKEELRPVVVRPTWNESTAKFIYPVNIDHPQHIKMHECWKHDDVQEGQ